jgi:hypothetical protein
MTAFGVGLLFVRESMLERGIAKAGPALWWATQATGVVGAAMLVGVAFGLAYMVQGRERVVRVTEHGVTRGRKHWPWVRIARFGGIKYSNGIAITFQLRGRGHGTRILITTPLLTAEQFVELARTVKAFAAETKTDVLVVEEPEVPTPD